MSPENKAHFLAVKEAIHLILTGIGDDIYSTVDAFQTAQEMWEAIERIQQGESLNIQDVKTNLFWEFGKFTLHDRESMDSYYTRFYKLMNEIIRNNLTVTTMQVNIQFLQQLQPKWSRFVTIVKQQHKLDKVSYHKLFDILKQYQNKVNELCAEKLVRNVNPLALVATPQAYREQYYQTSRTSSNSKNKNVDTTPRYKNDDHSGQFGTQRTVNVAAARENVGKTNDSNVTLDSPDMCEDDIQNEQNDVDSDDERVAFANLIANLKLDVDENKKIQKQLKKANTTLVQELKECKTILTKTSKSLEESISVRDSCLVTLQTKQAEVEKFKAFNDHTIDYDKLERKLNEALGQLAHKDTVIREGLKTKAYELLVVKEKHDELMKHSLLTKSHYEGLVKQKTKSLSDLDVLAELQCMYLHKVKQQKHSISLELALQKCKEQVKNDTVYNEKASNVFRKEREQYFKIQDWKAQLQDKNIAISELKKLIEKGKGKYVDTKFDRPYVVRQPNAQRIQKPSVLGKPTPFSDSLERKYFPKTKSVPKANVSEGLSKPVTAQTLPQTAKKAISNTNVLRPGMSKSQI
uniref:Integrase, catalytic region, zinc finger, CCHC-type, peptidase aspartic, catalytic n=1 Tax=Tanacetum cinerariifolium TaxID=118510 RepID=A0A699J6H6_TANCI|nr:hypothetical protein [Tanacetum cinerariifolium]